MNIFSLIKKFFSKQKLKETEEVSDEEKIDDTLHGQAMRRAVDLHKPRAGTPHDWEDWEKYKNKDPDRDKE